MELYLVQHGQATPKEVDATRPLTDQGSEEVTRVARWASAAGVRLSAIHHSGKLRARQTAEIIAAELGVSETPAMLDGMSPNDDPRAAADALETFDSPTMLVGHLPHMSRLCSLLVTRDPDAQIVQFQMGGIVALQGDESGRWVIRWMLTPEVAAPQ